MGSVNNWIIKEKNYMRKPREGMYPEKTWECLTLLFTIINTSLILHQSRLQCLFEMQFSTEEIKNKDGTKQNRKVWPIKKNKISLQKPNHTEINVQTDLANTCIFQHNWVWYITTGSSVLYAELINMYWSWFPPKCYLTCSSCDIAFCGENSCDLLF